MFSSMHTHTIFCDGKDDIETMCRTAYEKKMFAIGFSAHAPITKKTGIPSQWHLPDEKLDEYVTEVLAAKERWRGKIDVFLGLEVDYIKGLRSAVDSDIIAINPDYLIGSIHYVVPANGAEPFTIDGHWDEFTKGLAQGFNGDAEALMHSYYDATAEMIAIGGFEILGHADLLKKNCHNKNLWNKESEISRQEEIARAIASSQAIASERIIVEANTGGLNRGKINETYPSPDFLRIFNKNNVPVIITSDAHCAKDIDGNYNTAITTLNYANFSEHLLFLGKNNGKMLWKIENIT
jgi:histidinol-phosphatase (PHP family)